MSCQFYIYFLLLLTVNSNGYAQDTTEIKQAKHVNKGFLDFNGYYDTREFSVMTLNLLAVLPHRFQYFSLTNFQGPTRTSDLSNYYSEQNVRWNFMKNIPLDFTSQWVLKSGINNDVLKFGFRWSLHKSKGLRNFFKKLNLSYSINPFFIQFAQNKQTQYLTQIEHVYKLKILPTVLNDRIYIGGFIDQNFLSDNNKVMMKFVTEHQLGLRIIDQLYAVLEFRINEYLPNDNYGFGYGLEYKIKF